MLAIVYRFEVIPGQEAAFADAWAALTRATESLDGSLGSRLHRDVHHPRVFWGYAQWKNAEIRDRALANTDLSADLNARREAMQSCLRDVGILFEGEVDVDLLHGS